MIKGNTRIELTNVYTKEKKVVEHHNMITNALVDMNKRVYGVNGMDTFLYMYAKQFLGANDPFWRSMFSGIILFKEPLSDSAEEYIFPAGNKVTGCGDIERVKTQEMRDESCTIMGNFNSDESVLSEKKAKMVYDFATSQGNGQISSIALCNKLLARSCYNYGSNMDGVALYGAVEYERINAGRLLMTKNCVLKGNIADSSWLARDGNRYTISYFYHDTDEMSIQMSTRLNYNSVIRYNEKTVTVDLGAGDYTYTFKIDDKNIIIFYSKSTGKFKYICLTDGTVYEKDVPIGYYAVYPFDGYFVALKQDGSTYSYSVLKDDGTILFENVLNAGNLPSCTGMLGNRYVLFHNNTIYFMIDLLSGGVSKFYVNISSGFDNYGANITNTPVFDNILHIYGSNWSSDHYWPSRTCFSKWQPWLTTKNNLESPVIKTSAQTMKITYTISEE